VTNKKKSNDKMKIIYTGTISSYVKAERLNLAYQKLLRDHPELKGKIEIDIYGQKGYYYYLKYRKTLVQGINFKGFINHDDLMNRLAKDADIGYFSLINERYAYAMPSKLFEYINLELPILASLPDGEAKSLVEQHQIGKVAQMIPFSDFTNSGIFLTVLRTHDMYIEGVNFKVERTSPIIPNWDGWI